VGGRTRPSGSRSTLVQDDKPRSALAENVVRTGTVGTALALVTQVLSFATFIVLAHYAPPSTFGDFAAASVLLGLSGLFTEAGMHAAVVQRQDKVEEAASTAFVANIVGGFALCLAAAIASPIIGFFFGSRLVGLAAAVLAGTIPLNATCIVPSALIRRRVSARLLFVPPITVIANAVAAVPLLAAGLGVWALVIAIYVATAIRILVVWMLAAWRPEFRLASWEMWRSLSQYGRPVMVSLFLREAGFAGITAFVGRAFNTTILGQFRYAQRLVVQSTSSITLSSAFVLLPAFTRIVRDERRFAAGVLRSLRILSLLVFPISLAFIPLGRPIAEIFLGEEWSGAGPIMMGLAGVGVSLCFSSVCAEAFKACGRTDLLPRLHAITATAPVALMFVLLPAGPVGMGLGVSAGLCLESLYAVRALSRVLQIPLLTIFRQTQPAFVGSLVMVSALFALETHVFHAASASGIKAVMLLALEGALGTVAYLLTLAVVSGTSLIELRRTLGYLVRRPRAQAPSTQEP
jgi:O-antigen/teichoic acid export membrane protein